jgi:hypothetical protein
VNFPSYKRCRVCGETFCGGPSQRHCGPCLERARKRQGWRRRSGPNAWRSYAPTPHREAVEQGDADLAQRALRGELD